MAVRFGLRIPPCEDARLAAEFARRVEEAGFDAAWFPDSQFLWRDVWATLALAADRTERLLLGTAVTNFETRNPAVTASAAATIEELAPGRFRLGVATGDSAVKTLGIAPTSIGRMRERIELVRTLLAGEPASFGGTEGPYANRRMRVRGASRRPVSVYLAATAPRALALAGEVCDGVILLVGTAPDLVDAALAHVARGAEAAGRSLTELDLCLAAHTAVTADADEAARLVKPLVLTSAQLGGSEALRRAGIEVDVPPVLAGVYPDVTHAEHWEAAIAAAEAYVPDEAARRYAEAFALAGPPGELVTRIRAAAERGITSLYVLGLSSYVLPVDLLDAFRGEILPAFRIANADSRAL